MNEEWVGLGCWRTFSCELDVGLAEVQPKQEIVMFGKHI
jgi:hypothetical protein